VKKLLVLFSFLSLPSLCHAIGGEVPQLVYQVGITTATQATISVSTSSIAPGATLMDTPTLSNRVSVEIQNIDTSANLWCSFTSTAPIVNGGRKISAGSSWVVSVTDRWFIPTASSPRQTNLVNFYCLSDGAAATKAYVTQIY